VDCNALRAFRLSVLGFYEDILQREVMVKCDEGPSGSHEQVVKLHSVFIGKSKEIN